MKDVCIPNITRHTNKYKWLASIYSFVGFTQESMLNLNVPHVRFTKHFFDGDIVHKLYNPTVKKIDTGVIFCTHTTIMSKLLYSFFFGAGKDSYTENETALCEKLGIKNVLFHLKIMKKENLITYSVKSGVVRVRKVDFMNLNLIQKVLAYIARNFQSDSANIQDMKDAAINVLADVGRILYKNNVEPSDIKSFINENFEDLMVAISLNVVVFYKKKADLQSAVREYDNFFRTIGIQKSISDGYYSCFDVEELEPREKPIKKEQKSVAKMSLHTIAYRVSKVPCSERFRNIILTEVRTAFRKHTKVQLVDASDTLFTKEVVPTLPDVLQTIFKDDLVIDNNIYERELKEVVEKIITDFLDEERTRA